MDPGDKPRDDGLVLVIASSAIDQILPCRLNSPQLQP
jgi:hypothetical protein